MKNRPFISGIIAAASPFPLFVFTVLWTWIWGIGIGIGLLHYDTIPQWILLICLLPLWISPLLGIAGLVHSFLKIKARRAWLGIILSVVGLVENFLLIYSMAYLGSRF